MFALSVPLSHVIQSATPDTSGYMIAGFVVIFTLMLAYLASLIVRRRNLEQDYEMLEELEKGGGNSEGTPQHDHAGIMEK
jgi:CcmD family protein